MLVIPRAALSIINEREELHSPAFYILLGEDDGITSKAYLGETENFRERIKNHEYNKAFWQKTLVFISKDGAMTKADVLPTLKDPETIILVVADLISKHGVLATIIAGLILAGILAATMSTADSQLLAASSSASQNILKEVFMKDMSEKTGMLIARITVLVIALIGVFIARNPDSSVFQIVSFAWAGFGASFGPLVLLALFWKRSTFQGALCGMVSGGVMVFVWKFLIRPMGGALGIYELLPAFLLGLAVNVIVSLLTPAPSREVQDEFDKVASMK